MTSPRPNPFEVTKAADFNDEEIAAYFVDIPGAGFGTLANPTSPMPMLIMGGKGSGKTHLMRYFSYPLQKLRHVGDIVGGTRSDGFIGIYLRCGGLNAVRFKGKGQKTGVWESVFSYYMELWLAQLVLTCAADFRSAARVSDREREIATESFRLLDETNSTEIPTIQALIQQLQQWQKELDWEINNCALTHKLNIQIRATSGRLIFGIPQVLARENLFKHLQFLYLLDEFENLGEDQQRYVNTLLREKELPCSFKIGGRTYGFKTFKTYSAHEDIKEGSEFEILPLDARLRSSTQYSKFAQRLCARRLIKAEYAPIDSLDLDSVAPTLRDAFEIFPPTPLLEHETAFVNQKYEGRERPYFGKLRAHLKSGMAGRVALGVKHESDLDFIVSKLGCPTHPILEKINIFRLYQFWRKNEDLKHVASRIGKQCEAYIHGRGSPEYSSLVEKRKSDMLAQLLRECDQKQNYVGFDTFVAMSEGLPRNLLVILKKIFNWGAFNGENPFAGGKVSTASQREGVREAAEWFFDDARMPGDDGSMIRDGVSRLATLFREVRFSDKPSEKAVSTFSADLSQCSAEARRIIHLADKWSLLISITGGQRDRNSMRVDAKFYINAMLSPKWDLPVSRGGTLALTPNEIDAIFDPAHAASFPQLLQQRIAPMTAPYFGVRKPFPEITESSQSSLELE